uniref:Uncharacterized protein n=1 Tax=Strongyloides venezuelensis TaxID=75913 RepID=A0A0K0FGB9_STRVS
MVVSLVLLASLVHSHSTFHFACPTNQIFIASYVGRETIKIHCDGITFCHKDSDYRRKGIMCKYYEDEYACGGKTIFLSEIRKDFNEDRIRHTCCLNKNNAFNAFNCHIHEIPEKKIRKINDDSFEFTSSEEGHLRGRIGFQTSSEESDPYQFFTIPFNRLKYNKKPKYVVKSISKTK